MFPYVEDDSTDSKILCIGFFSLELEGSSFITREHLGLLPSQQKGGVESPSSDISVEDPASDEFYLNTWMKAAINNTQLYRQVCPVQLTDY